MDRTATIFHQSSYRQVHVPTIGLEFDTSYILALGQKKQGANFSMFLVQK